MARCKLLWAPTPDALLDRIQQKWPDARMEAHDGGCSFFEDDTAQARRGFRPIHASWDGSGCTIDIHEPKSQLGQYLLKWEPPVCVGDTYDIIETGYQSHVRTVQVIAVTSKSFKTSDGIKWSLRGCTPWATHNLALKAIPKREITESIGDKS